MQTQFFFDGDHQPLFPVLRGRNQADVVVIGGGLSGLTTALWIAKAGLRVYLLESKTVMGGISQSCAGMVSVANGLIMHEVMKNFGASALLDYAQTQMAAFQAVKAFALSEGESVAWKDETLYLLAQDQNMAQKMTLEAKVMQAVGWQAQLGVAPHSPWNAKQSLMIPAMGSLNPVAYQGALIRQASDIGVQIHEHSRVTSVHANVVSTESGSITAPYVVVATGYPIVNVPGWYFCKMRQKRAYLCAFEQSMHYQGLFVDVKSKASLQPQARGSLCYLEDGFVGNKQVHTPQELLQQQTLEGIDQNPLYGVMSAIETLTADGLPYVGTYSKKTPNLFVATGYAGRGIVGSMVAAQGISARILGVDAKQYQIYQGDRKGKQTRNKQVRMASISGWQFLKGFWQIQAPRCPHMGCKMRYNATQRLWECPCHGSRFDDIGHLLNAPAMQDTYVRRK